MASPQRRMSSTIATSSMGAERRSSSTSDRKESFPDFDLSQPGEYLAIHEEDGEDGSLSARTPSPNRANGALHSARWQPHKESYLSWGDRQVNASGPRSHGRQKSLSDAFRTIRTRKGSLSANAHEIAEALKAPVSSKIVVSMLYGFR